ncbi:MAG: hypothetical protein NTY38_21975 [Acidobacteria bacterium]|nr:hypothetical protein [Acidobacteriota bacterium]
MRFTPGWGAPGKANFEKLVSWTDRPEAGIRYYSGAATYDVSFDVPATSLTSELHLELDLGVVNNLAEVRLNGQDMGVLWKPPFRVDVSKSLKAKGNRLEVKVVNLWPNRLIGDESLPREKRFTKTNMFKFTATSPLKPSGLLGPVRIVATREVPVRW